MAEDDYTLTDMAGVYLLPHSRAYMFWTGHWVGAVPGPTPVPIMVARALGGTLTYVAVFVVCWGSLNGIMHGSGTNDMPMNLIIISCSISSVHKYCVYTNQEQGLGRLGRWMKRVSNREKKNKIPKTITDHILKVCLLIFYYSGTLAAFMLLTKLALTGTTYNVLVPGLENVLLLKLAIALSFMSLGFEVVVDALILMNSLFTFRRELMRSFEEWRKLNFDSENPNQYKEELKERVQKHIELLTIFQDLREFNNSMFGYQVFAIVFTTCALLYGMAKETENSHKVFVQTMPTATASFLEFFILCWCGEDIKFGFEQIHRSIYDTNWYEASLEDKKSMTIVLEFSKNPIILTGFTVFKANLETFVESMRQSFSLYTILSEMV
ncbi:hypothetical protein GE061_009283 [Apolygus lucorum]|uniref:Odorant receptor n=1 Tax=Apolygus lucorum TaxID=248454 RepID=A0A1Q1NIN6_APOLU|nr:olfactory receptor [Apolygus lucorum]KAF6214540.1 hypothetical protein GE061_009283 [Apolygus lucorum]QQP20023.1 olfactory receptor 57 [Apolygus lucorum]